MNDSLKSRLMKLLALAERGAGGEAHNARSKLDAALAENGITVEDLMDEEKTMQRFPYRGALEKMLLRQILSTVCGFGAKLYEPIHGVGLMAKMTPEQKVEVSILWSTHRAQFKKELDLFLHAYIYRQHLFPRDGDVRDVDDLSPEERERFARIAQLMAGIEKVNVRRQLCGKV